MLDKPSNQIYQSKKDPGGSFFNSFLHSQYGFHGECEGGVSAVFSPVSFIVPHGGYGVCGEEDLGEGLSSESGAGGKGAAFHIDGLAAGFFHLFDLFLRFAEEGVGGPDGAGHAGDISFGKDFLYMRERFFIEDDGVGFGEVVEGGAFVLEGFLNGKEGVLGKVGEGAAAADGEKFFSAVGKESLFHEDGSRCSGRGLDESDFFFSYFYDPDGKVFCQRHEFPCLVSFVRFGEGLDMSFRKKCHDGVFGKGKAQFLKAGADEPFFRIKISEKRHENLLILQHSALDVVRAFRRRPESGRRGMPLRSRSSLKIHGRSEMMPSAPFSIVSSMSFLEFTVQGRIFMPSSWAS